LELLLSGLRFSDTLRNRELARLIGVPSILGVLEHLQGMFIDATSRCGFPTILFQGGGNSNDDTVIHHKGLIWKLLKLLCNLEIDQIPGTVSAIQKLNSFAIKNNQSQFFEITYSHKISEDSQFVMNPGYLNFQPIKKNEELAKTGAQIVKAPISGQLFLPLYQGQGTEGFYIVTPIASFWIRFSRRFRLFKYHQKLNWLAGVKKINSDPLIFKIDLHVTFIWAEEIFHLLGYIKVKQDGRFLYMTRREDERNPPTVREAIKQFTTQ